MVSSCYPGVPAPSGTTYTPSFADWQTWLYATLGIPVEALPTNSIYLALCYDTAVATVNQQLLAASPPIYYLALYNLGADLIINWAPDQFTNGVVFPYPTNNPDDLGYFEYLRKKYGCLSFVAGVITASADESTSATYQVIQSMEGLTLDQLSNLNTPWGRIYLGLASKVGTLWGIS